MWMAVFRCFGVELLNGSEAEVKSWSPPGGFRGALWHLEITEPVFTARPKPFHAVSTVIASTRPNYDDHSFCEAKSSPEAPRATSNLQPKQDLHSLKKTVSLYKF